LLLRALGIKQNKSLESATDFNEDGHGDGSESDEMPEYAKRHDFMLQERGAESLVKTLGILKSHTSYFANSDVAHFILMKLHNEKVNILNPAR